MPVEQEEPERPIRPLFSTPGMKLWLLVALNFGCYGILILFAGSSAFSWIIPSQETSTPMIAKLSSGFFTLFTFLVPAAIFANAALPQGFDYYKLHRRVRIAPLLVGMFTILASVFFIDLVGMWNTGLITDPEWIAENVRSEAYGSWAMQMPGIADLLVCLLCSAVVPAVCEELFFRGGLQQLLLEWTRKPHAAIIIAAFIFSVLHIDPFGFIVRFLLGVVLGYLFWWSGSLRLAVAGHFTFNAFMIINQYFVQHNPESWWARAETTYILGAVSLVVSLGALFTCRNLLKRHPARV